MEKDNRENQRNGWIIIQNESQDVTDPFVDVRLGNARIAKTSVIDNDLNPVWNEKFRIEVCVTARSGSLWSKCIFEEINVQPVQDWSLKR